MTARFARCRKLFLPVLRLSPALRFPGGWRKETLPEKVKNQSGAKRPVRPEGPRSREAEGRARAVSNVSRFVGCFEELDSSTISLSTRLYIYARFCRQSVTFPARLAAWVSSTNRDIHGSHRRDWVKHPDLSNQQARLLIRHNQLIFFVKNLETGDSRSIT